MPLLVVLSLFAMLSGCTKKESLSNNQLSFLNRFKVEIKSGFCNDESFFRSCFKVEYSECIDFVKDNFDKCTPSEVPEVITAKSGRKFGRSLGSCLGEKYEIHFVNMGKGVDKNVPACLKARKALGM